jgi:hypothetical protein
MTNQTEISVARRIAVPVAVVIAGALVGSGIASGYNGHGPEAGFAGMILFFGLFPALGCISSFVAMLARNTRYGNWATAVGAFCLSMSLGAMFIR